jgi:hypothetical protein
MRRLPRTWCEGCHGDKRYLRPTEMFSILVQVAHIGTSPRRRAQSVSVRICHNCASSLASVIGRPVRKRLTLAVMKQVNELVPLEGGKRRGGASTKTVAGRRGL